MSCGRRKPDINNRTMINKQINQIDRLVDKVNHQLFKIRESRYQRNSGVTQSLFYNHNGIHQYPKYFPKSKSVEHAYLSLELESLNKSKLRYSSIHPFNQLHSNHYNMATNKYDYHFQRMHQKYQQLNNLTKRKNKQKQQQNDSPIQKLLDLVYEERYLSKLRQSQQLYKNYQAYINQTQHYHLNNFENKGKQHYPFQLSQDQFGMDYYKYLDTLEKKKQQKLNDYYQELRRQNRYSLRRLPNKRRQI